MMQISVVVPTHNRASLLMSNLNTLSGQTLASDDFEVIVVADGCTDQTIQMLEGLQPPYRLTVLDQTPGRGAAAARNLGASRASADILVFLDDDMEANPQLLAE